MSEFTAEQIAQRAFDLNLLTQRQLHDVWGAVGSRQMSGDEFRQLLERRELLTNYQSDRLLRGEKTGFFYGDYKVLYLVGTGTFARVYRAAHGTTGELRAVKVLRRRFVENPVESDRFSREGQMGATLRHPNIVPIYQVQTQGDNPFIVMDFVEGRNLREFIRVRKKFEPVEATKVMIDVTAGLAYAFDRGICHRDLKLSNILVSSRGQAKLVDFGLAGGEATEDDPEFSNPRTIDYAGLERATGVRKDDQRSDIYFVGCMYYHLLAGVSPLVETRERAQRLSRSRYQNITPILTLEPGLPRAIANVVSKAIELNPSQRYQTPAELNAELQMALVKMNEPETVPGAPAAEAPARPKAATVQRSLMIVESNVELQNLLRERLKSSGYRVLVTQDPQRALVLFAEEPKTADCIMFCAEQVGEAALNVFNAFGENAATKDIPALLMLGVKQQDWAARAQTDKHRVILQMPIKLRAIRNTLSELLPAPAAVAEK